MLNEHDENPNVIPENIIGMKNVPTKEAFDRIVRDSDEKMIEYFSFYHLLPDLFKVSAKFAILAIDIVTILPKNAERTAALRKLLESKDCAVRAAIY